MNDGRFAKSQIVSILKEADAASKFIGCWRTSLSPLPLPPAQQVNLVPVLSNIRSVPIVMVEGRIRGFP